VPARHPVIDPLTSRRTAVGGALAGLVALSGCDPDPGSDEPTSQQTTAPAVDGDAALVDGMAERIVETRAIVAEARRLHDDLRRPLRPLVDLHAAHLEALDPVDGTFETLTSSPQGLKQVRRAEASLQRHLVGASVRAESGALAKLFASMAAAVAQHLAVLR
jgi:hypothetical protein